MLLSVVLPFEDGREALRWLRGDLVHRYVLALIQARDPALSAALHRDARHKPFTAALLRSDNGHGACLRLTALDGPVAAQFDVLSDPPPVTCDGRAFAFAGVSRSHPLACRSDPGTLWRVSLHGPAVPPRVRLRFVTPTAFDSPTGLFPLPALVCASLGRKWARQADPAWAPEASAVEALGAALRVVRHDLRTERVSLGRYHATGFTGECDLALLPGAPPVLARLLHLLAGFAFYAGVGLKTTMGMGQVRPGRVHAGGGA